MALTNLLRVPGRTLGGVVALAVGVAALTLLLGVTQLFQGAVVGSLLGNVIAVQVRGVDYAAVVITTLLGAAAVADVLYLGIRERATELATLTATGWRPSSLTRLILTEALCVGLLGSALGAGIGLGVVTTLGATPNQLVVPAMLALAAGVVATMVASLLPSRAVRRLPAAIVLAEE
ncbi:MAG: ABC transporter permease [Intrasporangium sp.]|uniref:FtsX-like permease family protein n=1 Tax=Intrasporangium sp. TaxID=1925024 RepID=UPI002649C170|nr:ABC transporter permease [Intrasporangium sp.]MDN5796768.1 ABC transporter permease [Intrasporangium sp.]